jgi:hypothetical protein
MISFFSSGVLLSWNPPWYTAGYVAHAVFELVDPGVPERFVLLSVIAEVATLVWLLAFGVKRPSKK